MAFQPTSGENQVFYNDATNQYHLINIDPSDGTQTDLGVISQADTQAALASLETQVDLTTTAVTSLETQVDLTTTAVASVETQVDLVTDEIAARNAIDAATNARITLENDHNQIHDGRSYHICDVQNVSSTTEKWLITTPDTTRFSHIVFDIRATGEMSVTITEGADRTGSNALDEINRHRESPLASTVIVTDPVFTFIKSPIPNLCVHTNQNVR